jgi:hypothetical protein
MAEVTIPVSGEFPAFNFQILLDGNRFKFEFRWVERKQTWIMNLYDEAGTALVAGVPILAGIDLLGRSGGPTFPEGSIISMDLTGQSRKPDRETFGKDVVLLYATED